MCVKIKKKKNTIKPGKRKNVSVDEAVDIYY